MSWNRDGLDRDGFAALPLDSQLETLEGALGTTDPRRLLELAASLRDTLPLAWLTERLLARGWAADAETRAWFAEFLVERPETAVHRVLRTLAASHTVPAEQVSALLVAALEIVTVDRLAVLCLLDRTLKHHDPAGREAHVEANQRRALGELQTTGEVSIDRLAQVRAEAVDALRAAAPSADAFDAAHRRLARRVVEVLGQAPKAVSQANAEDLLARRVYTDPGHFLIELLQNAEDAGAKTWRVIFEPRRLVVWHDGTLFDARDVVGVCSIGQTTKKKQQIGFFGVGFKSVYEITDRPQVYSGVYAFEIADVSIPKLLARRPADLPPDGTVLVLPLRDPDDPERSPATLYAKAAGLDPCVLLTLPSIDVLDFEWTAARTTATGATSAKHRIREQVLRERLTAITQEPDGWRRAYWLDALEVVWTGGERDVGRADRTRVMVGVRTSADGVPEPLADGAATLYSFLPTREHSGLRFFVQAHFDVPVDRERLDPDSEWNSWILGHVPGLLARLASSLATQPNAVEGARGFLTILPHGDDLGTPLLRVIHAGLPDALGDIPCLPTAHGDLQAPRRTLAAGPRVVELFGDATLDGRWLGRPGESLAFLDLDLSERGLEIARHLGCVDLDGRAVVELLERVLADDVPPETRPEFLRQPTVAQGRRVFELLHGVLEQADRDGTGDALAERLARLPIFPCDDGQSRPLRRPGAHPWATPARATPDLRRVYGGLRPFLDPAFDADRVTSDAATSSARVPARVTELFDRLAVPRLDLFRLVEDLEASLEGFSVLEHLDATRFPGDAERLEAVLAVLAGAGQVLVEHAARLPLFAADDGRFHRAATALEVVDGEPPGVVLVEEGAADDALRSFYAGRRPLAVGAPGSPSLELLERAGTPRLGPSQLLADLAGESFDDDARRQLFQRWLVANEHVILSVKESRQALAGLPFLRSAGGRLLTPKEVVIDPDLPDLGIDWAPHPTTEPDLLDLLKRHFGSGRPKLDTLVRSHLRPAYHAASEAKDGPRAAEILVYLAGRLEGRSEARIRGLLPGMRIEDQRGRFRKPGDLVVPEPSMVEWVTAIWDDTLAGPHPERLPPTLHPFLIALGVGRRPNERQITTALRRPRLTHGAAFGLAGLLGTLGGEDPSWFTRLPVAELPWVPPADGGALRTAAELFVRRSGVERILGNDDALYVDGRFLALLGDGASALPLGTLATVDMEDVVSHLERRIRRGQTVPLAVYQWFEDGLATGRVDGGLLASRLGDQPWITTDTGETYPHRHVLAVRALRFFGRRRGYWDTGRELCPRLCGLFDIPTAVTAPRVLDFVLEIGREVQRDGAEAVLERDLAVPRMLLACQAFLGQSVAEDSDGDGDAHGDGGPPVNLDAFPRHAAVILAQDPRGRRRLVAASTPGLFRSDTPALEALFADVGEWLRAERGNHEERQGMDHFLGAVGVPLLREAYAMEVGSRGRDVTAHSGPQIQGLRGTLRALVSVLPRVRLQRTLLDADGWVFEKRLAPLATHGEIRAIERLEVRLVLPEVGAAEQTAALAYDPKGDRLLLDAAALARPREHITGLASGLLPCIYEGVGADQLVEVLEILLPMATADAMDAYLDRRFFPRASHRETVGERWVARVGEILDYGLQRRLVTAFPELEGTDFEVWRRPEVAQGLSTLRTADGSTDDGSTDDGAMAEESIDSATTRAVELLLGAVDVPAVGRVAEVLGELLRAPDLSHLPAELAGRPVEAMDARDRATMDPGHGATRSTATQSAATRSAAMGPTSLDPAAAGGQAPEVPPDDPGRSPGAAPNRPPRSWAAQAGSPRSGGLWGFMRGLVSRWGGGAPQASPAPSPGGTSPRWARRPFESSGRIGPQLDFTAASRRDLESRAVDMAFVHRPARLPPPHLYAVHALGASFEPATQSWTPRGAFHGWKERLRPSGHRVHFQGRLGPGAHQLPVPLYGRATGNIDVDVPADRVVPPRRDDHGQIVLEIRPGPGGSAERVTVTYTVDLLATPPLHSPPVSFGEGHPLTSTTLAWSELPGEVRSWVDDTRRAEVHPWQRAVMAADFVKGRYLYDDGFLGRPEVQRARRRLRSGRGNHHLDLLHASGDARWLGRGVCFELNLMVVEVLRHLGIPAMAASGWVLDEGQLVEPDHLIAMAIVDSAAGPVPLPLDAAAGASGPIHTLRREANPRGASAPTATDFGPATVTLEPPPAQGAWASVFNVRAEDLAQRSESLDAAQAARHRREAKLLEEAILQVCMVRGLALPDTQERADLDRLLGSPALAAALLEVLRDGGSHLAAVPGEIHELARLGLVQVTTVPSYRVEPVE